MTEPSLTTVPDEARGKRGFLGILIGISAFSVGALVMSLFGTFRHVRSPEAVARANFNWSYQFEVVRASESSDRADAWLRASSSSLAMKPHLAVENLYHYFPGTYAYPAAAVAVPRKKVGAKGKPVAPAAKPVKAAPVILKRESPVGPNGERYGVEFDPKRREYHLWRVGNP